MVKESYIQFHYNYDNRESTITIQSFFLLHQLLKEKVSFTAIPVDEGFPSPQILIKTPETEVPSTYRDFHFPDSKAAENFRKQCRTIRESSLEKEVVSG